MIRNREEKEFVSKQIIHLENALADLKIRLLPNNAKMFEMMSLSYIDKIKELRREIDLYIGIEEKTIVEKSDIIIRLLGPEIGYGKAPISVVTSILSEVRKGFQNIFAHIAGYGTSTKYPKRIVEACDLSLTNVFEGSLQVALQRPDEQLSIFDELEVSEFQKTIDIYFKVARLAYQQASTDILKREIPNDELRYIAMKNVLRIIPKNSRRVKTIQLYGKLVKDDIYLTKKSRDYIIEKISKKEEEEIIYTFQGRIREIDLDKGSFRLRDLECEEIINEVICFINDDLIEDLKDVLDEVVVVKGPLVNETKTSKTLQVRFIETADNDNIDLKVN